MNLCVDEVKITQILITKRNIVDKCLQLLEKLGLFIYPGFSGDTEVKNPPSIGRDSKDMSSIPG